VLISFGGKNTTTCEAWFSFPQTPNLSPHALNGVFNIVELYKVYATSEYFILSASFFCISFLNSLLNETKSLSFSTKEVLKCIHLFSGVLIKI
jgi:hypothetical protein